MFEFFFKYPSSVFAKGTFVLLGSWPRWVLVMALVGLAGALAWLLWRKRTGKNGAMRGGRAIVLWALQTATLGTLLLILWEPALSVSALKPQQNIVAVIVDDSRSMALRDDGVESRERQAIKLLDSGLLRDLGSRFQVRLYRLGPGIERVQDLGAFTAGQNATQIGKGLRQVADEAGTLPIGVVVLLSDGADNSGGIDQATLSELRRRKLPVNTIGFGRETLQKDVELDGFEVPSKALAGSRLEAQVTIRQSGFGVQHAQLVLSSTGGTLATRDIVLQNRTQIENIEFDAGRAGVKNVEVRLNPLPGEQNTANNRLTRVLDVEEQKRRILYVEGEPRWEYKFLRRAAEDDPALQVASMLRITENKIYRQGIANPDELADGFPRNPDDLFAFQGLIVGSIESSFFSESQQELIKEFVDRRGGGALFLGGRWGLSDGGYNVQPFAELLPVNLPTRKNTFSRDMVTAELTEPGRQSLICRIEDDPGKSSNHWEVLPYLANYQDPGTPKPGATVLLRMNAGGNRKPLLITENYGRGRTGVFATGGSWRWRMQQPVGDTSQEIFWRQLLRWLVSATPSRVVASTPNANLEDNGHMELRAEVRDAVYLPTGDADVEANIVEPDGAADRVTLRPEARRPGIYSAEWDAAKTGSYVAEVTAKRAGRDLGADVVTFRRENGVAENFHQEQNRDVLQTLAAETGGKYYSVRTAKQLPQEIAYSEAGITTREMKDLWNMPAVFLAVIALRSAEWILRRKWGAV